MFERRLKIVLILFGLVGIVVLCRAAQMQIIQRDIWRNQAAKEMELSFPIETTRGSIYDRNGKLLAVDKPCIDACIDYRALTTPPDPEWLRDRAIDRLKGRLGEQWTAMGSKQRTELRTAEIAAVNSDIEQMWPRLAQVSGRSLDDIEQTAKDIVARIDTRKRYIWWKRYQQIVAKEGTNVEAVNWKQWITDGGDGTQTIDKFEVTVAEQLEPHVILPAISIEVQNQLGKDIDKYPGLILRPGTHRTYPYDDVACHLLGHLAHVDQADIQEHKGLEKVREYYPSDLIGKTGIEALCEPTLRGSRGKIDRVQGEQAIVDSQDAVAGKDVRLTIDIDLQQEIQSVFTSATMRDTYGDPIPGEENVLLHGAAVVLDVETNQVLALVSYPTYDLNEFDEIYSKLRRDEINDPLRNRATMSQLEPGSTAKPLCGLAGLCAGVIGVNTGIECTGYMKLDGRKISYGRCWVASQFLGDPRVPSVAHHPVPTMAPHVGHDGNLDGYLTFSDALERSCNVFHETVADWLGTDRLSDYYFKFGLGRWTGVGIGEAKGRLPRDYKGPPSLRRMNGFLAGIGQGYMSATPIQMANAAAMIARGGIWMRPILTLPDADGKRLDMRPGPAGGWQDIPDRVDLHIPPEAIKAAKLGMFNVVNGPAGTGKPLVAGKTTIARILQAIGICGKTGTAQASAFNVLLRDASGNIQYDKDHKPQYRTIEPSMPGQPSEEAPWLRWTVSSTGKRSLDHSWYIGFAPADHPKIAFAVMVEYGGSGGGAAASVARQALGSLIDRGYLKAPNLKTADAR